MRRHLIGLLIIPCFLLGCGIYTKAQRAEIVTTITEQAGKQIKKQADKMMPKLEEEATKAFTEKADELGLTPEKAAAFAKAAAALIREAIYTLLENQIMPAVKDVVDKTLPPASDETSGGLLKSLGGILMAGLQIAGSMKG